MTNAIVADAEALLAKLKAEFAPAEAVVVSDAEAIGDAAFNYIKTNGLADLYKIATAALLGAATGTSWATIAASVVSRVRPLVSPLLRVLKALFWHLLKLILLLLVRLLLRLRAQLLPLLHDAVYPINSIWPR